MESGDHFNTDLIKDKNLFKNIHHQREQFTTLFSEIANDFPQSVLEKYHSASKGCKVSQGWNLNLCPYQVLDIIRDFDSVQGLNIRILNWWGHGLYLILQIGKKANELSFLKKATQLKGWKIGNGNDPYNYQILFKSSVDLNSKSMEETLKNQNKLILFKELQYLDKKSIKLVILEEINLILDNCS